VQHIRLGRDGWPGTADRDLLLLLLLLLPCAAIARGGISSISICCGSGRSLTGQVSQQHVDNTAALPAVDGRGVEAHWFVHGYKVVILIHHI
jgi:hypothetical protein